jgi:phage terminase large subunit-like protein
MLDLLTSEFRPSQPQIDFLGSVVCGGAHTSLFIGGVGAGKSAIGALTALMMATAVAPGLTGMVVCPTFRSFAQTSLIEIRKWWPGEGRLWRLGRLDNYPAISIKTPRGNSTVLIRSAQDNNSVDEIRGPSLAWAWGDEVAVWGAGAYAYDVLIGRLRAPIEGSFPRIFLTSSPRWGWITKAFSIKGLLTESAWQRGLYLSGTMPENAVYLRASKTEDNEANAVNYAASMRSRYSDRFAAQECDGQFVPPTGAVYPQFYPQIHVIPHTVAMQLFRGCQYRIGGVDWGFGDPGALIALGIDHDGRFIVIREWSESGKTEAEMGAIASRWHDELGISTWYCPPDRKQGIALWRGDIAGVPAVRGTVAKARNDIDAGLEAVRNAMRLNAKIKHPSDRHPAVGFMYLINAQD